MRCKLILLLLLGSVAFAGAVQAQGEATFKVGLSSVTMQDAQYTHQDMATSTSVSTKGNVVGTELFVEYLASEFFGFEMAYITSPLERNYDLGTFADNVLETATYYTYGVNLYMSPAFRRGFNTWVGVATGTLTVKHEFELGGVVAQTTTNEINLDVVKAGFDWTTDFAGFRLRYQNQVAKTGSTTKIVGIKQTLDYSGSGIAMSVFLRF